jgi:Na+-translocating ferredoxin:NAD+ oxidoreductase RnfE subunit
MTAKRHPVRGFFAGLLLGLGIALLLFVLGVLPMTLAGLGIITAIGIVVGIVLAYVAPVRVDAQQSG